MARNKAGNAKPENDGLRLDQAYQALKQSIILYRLKPGAALRPQELAGLLDMSQTPVREALIRLEQEGFAQRNGTRGYVVSGLDLAGVEDLYELRIILETAGVKKAARDLKKPASERINRVLEDAMPLILDGPKRESLTKQQDFHAEIMAAGGNAGLAQMAGTVLDQVARVQNLDVFDAARLTRAHEDHLAIFEAVKLGQEDQAADLMERHLSAARDYLLARLRDHDDMLSSLLDGISKESLALP